MKDVKMSLETAKALYAQGGAAQKLALDTYTVEELTKKDLPKTWEELGKIDGWFVNNVGVLGEVKIEYVNKYNKNTFATEAQAKAALALAQLSQLKKVYCGDWVPDWKNSERKYSIIFEQYKIELKILIGLNAFLSFPTADLRDQFLANFRDLIEQAKPLMS